MTSRRAVPFFLSSLVLALTACATQPMPVHRHADRMPAVDSTQQAALIAAGPAGLRVAAPGHWVSGYVERADQVEAARALGIRTVISLVPPEERPEIDEQALVTGAGLRFLSVPVAGPADLTPATVDALTAALQSAGDAPVLIHCASANRVGALMALKAAWRDGKDSESALGVGRAYGMTRLDSVVRERLEVP